MKKITCGICKKTMLGKNKLKRHFKEFHPTEKLLIEDKKVSSTENQGEQINEVFNKPDEVLNKPESVKVGKKKEPIRIGCIISFVD